MLFLSSMTSTLCPANSLPFVSTRTNTPANAPYTIFSDHHHAHLLSLLDQRTPISHIKQIHAQTIRSSPFHRHTQIVRLYSRLLYFSSFHDVDYAFRLFSQIPTSTLFLWNTLIRACADVRKDDAFVVYSEMLTQGRVVPDKHTFAFVLKACASSLNESAGKQVHAQLLKLGFGSDVNVIFVLIHFYRSCGLLDSAWKLFDKMSEKSWFLWKSSFGGQERECLRIETKCISKEAGGKEDHCIMSATIANPSHVLSTSQTTQQDTYAPLVTALKSAAEDNAASFHFPGHNRGQAAPSPLTQLIGKMPYVYDLPELPELDNLFASEGPILDAQKQAAKVFGASETWFLTGGTTCGVQAAIMATCSPGDTLILPRNSHISAISGMVLSGATPKYIIPDYDHDWEIAAPVTASQVNEAIKDLELEGRKPAAVFVISPTYHGMCSNLGKISEVCSTKDIPLIVDEAHGAHFGFHPQLPFSALKQGADLALQSTHKVLCALTQSSMLHRSGKLVDRERISRCLQIIQSTSPSYLLLASLDATTAQLATNPESIFNSAIQLANEAKALIKQIPGLLVLDTLSSSEDSMIDPLRLTVGVWELGLSGYEADEFLHKDQGVMSELIGSRSITFVFTPGTREDHVKRLIQGLENLSKSFLSGHRVEHSMKHMETEPLGCIKMQLNPREAFFARKRKVYLKESIGKICGELICPYPPGIPAIIPGEVITDTALNYILEIKRQGGVITGASDPLLLSIVICD